MKQFMSEVVFKKYWRTATLPGVDKDLDDDSAELDGKSEVYSSMLQLLKFCVECWRAAWSPGDILCCDESMIFWRGTGEVHVTYQPRKPTPYGIELKTMVCAKSRIMLSAELYEGKDVDATKQYRDQVGATTACTLRLTAPYKGSARIVVADSWFGSRQTAEWLMDEMVCMPFLPSRLAIVGTQRHVWWRLCGASASPKSF